MTREELKEKAIEKLKSNEDEKYTIKALCEVSAMYAFYLNDCVSPFSYVEFPFIAAAMTIVGKSMLESLDEEGKKIANGIIDSSVVVSHIEEVDEK